MPFGKRNRRRRYWSRQLDKLQSKGFQVPNDPQVLEEIMKDIKVDNFWMQIANYIAGVSLFAGIALWIITGKGFGTIPFTILYELAMLIIIALSLLRRWRRERLLEERFKRTSDE